MFSIENKEDVLQIIKSLEFEKSYIKWDIFNQFEWSYIIIHKPHLAEKCTKIAEYNFLFWSTVISEQPQFLETCTVLDDLDMADWDLILSKQPQLIDKCPFQSKFKLLFEDKKHEFLHKDRNILIPINIE